MRTILLLASSLILLPAVAANAETVTRSLEGQQLELHLSCVRSVDIQPAAELHGKVDIAATADSHDELAPLDLTSSGSAARIERKGNCPQALSLPTLTLAIKVPPGTPIDLHEAGAGRYTIGPVGAALKVDVAGAGNVQAENATALDLTEAGSGTLALRKLDGPGTIDIRGSGYADIVEGKLPSLAITVRGSGAVKLGAGEIGTLIAEITGSCTVRIDGTVQDATLTTTGSGTITVAKATGKVVRHKSGSGEISVGQ